MILSLICIFSGAFVSHVSRIKTKFLQNSDANMSGDAKVINGNSDPLMGKEKFTSAKKVVACIYYFNIK